MRIEAAEAAPATALESAWRIAAAPAVALLGIVLPVCMIILVGQYLFYLRPSELLPTYATAWLLLALPSGAAWFVVAMTLSVLKRHRSLRAPYHVLAALLLAVSAAGTAAAVFFATLMWVRTYGWLLGTSLGIELTLLAAVLGALGALTRRGIRFMDSLLHVASWGTAAGALTLITLPFFGWSTLPAVSPGAPATAPGPRPHIVILTLDALSAEHMSLYGARRVTTPMLAAFAGGAMTFERAYANANFTTPGISSILTGTRPWTHRALQLPGWPRAATRATSLPALLRSSGYQMGYVATNAEGGATKLGFGQFFEFAGHPRSRGVGACSDALSAFLRYACAASELPPFQVLGKLDVAFEGDRDNREYDPVLAIEPALEWLRSVDKARSVFLWVHLFPPHSPYAAPPPWLGHFDSSPDARTALDSEPNWGFKMSRLPSSRIHTLAARYDESIRWVDHYAGTFLSEAARILGPNTVFIISSDHGESFTHGYGGHQGPALFDSLIHVPLIIKLPYEQAGLRSAMLAEQVDIAPTIAALVRIPAPAAWEGHSLLAAWPCGQRAVPEGDGCREPSSAESAGSERPVFSMDFEENGTYHRLRTGSIAVIQGRWKLIHYMGALHYPLMPPLSDQLYDLSTDPGESRNRIAEQPQEAQALRLLIAQELARTGGPVR